MVKISRKVSDELRDELKRLSYAYRPTKCYVLRNGDKEEIDCRELVSEVFKGSLSRGYMVCNERNGNCIELGPDDEVLWFDVTGKEVYFKIDECTNVKENDKIGYIVTGKGEVRTVRAPKSGYVVLIHEILGEKYSWYRVVMVVKHE